MRFDLGVIPQLGDARHNDGFVALSDRPPAVRKLMRLQCFPYAILLRRAVRETIAK